MGDCLGEYNEHIAKVSNHRKGVDCLVKVIIDHRVHCNVSAEGMLYLHGSLKKLCVFEPCKHSTPLADTLQCIL